jgi:elongation factor Ts
MAKITAKMVKELRDMTGSGLLDCKEALTEANGDMEKAKKILMAKSKAIATKKAGRSANEGLIDTYIHGENRVGVMVEVNCESDFVARSDPFKKFVKELMLQITAMSPKVVKIEDLDQAELEEMRSAYREEAAKSGKPEKVLDKIVEGRLAKWYQDVVLLEQPYIRDDSMKVKDLLTEVIGKVGENVVIRRFVRYEIGK